jgi:ribose transport system permease protein
MNATVHTAQTTERQRTSHSRTRAERTRDALSFRNIGAVYVWLVIVVIFSIWIPSTFANWTTAKQILNQNSVTALMALALIIPLCTRTFDRSGSSRRWDV